MYDCMYGCTLYIQRTILPRRQDRWAKAGQTQGSRLPEANCESGSHMGLLTGRRRVTRYVTNTSPRHWLGPGKRLSTSTKHVLLDKTNFLELDCGRPTDLHLRIAIKPGNDAMARISSRNCLGHRGTGVSEETPQENASLCR